MPRAAYVFEKQGFTVVKAPTAFATSGGDTPEFSILQLLPSAGALSASYYAIHEYVGGLWYRIRY